MSRIYIRKSHLKQGHKRVEKVILALKNASHEARQYVEHKAREAGGHARYNACETRGDV